MIAQGKLVLVPESKYSDYFVRTELIISILMLIR